MNKIEFEDLDYLHSYFDWIPSYQQFLDSQTGRNKFYECQVNIWRTRGDMIRHYVFGLPYLIEKNKRIVSKRPNEIKFVKNKFPYTDYGNHYVLWYPFRHLVNDIQIEKDIVKELRNKNYFGSFVWYVNKKKSIPHYFHVQVFIEPQNGF